MYFPTPRKKIATYKLNLTLLELNQGPLHAQQENLLVAR